MELLEAPNNLHLTVPKTGSDIKLTKNTWKVMHFFICIAVRSHRKIPKDPKF